MGFLACDPSAHRLFPAMDELDLHPALDCEHQGLSQWETRTAHRTCPWPQAGGPHLADDFHHRHGSVELIDTRG